jgi:EAL domain-containing protein (putative c-di-GMP-specific phosphodiesterase class I)/CHASE2 domain-containing sensor protein
MAGTQPNASGGETRRERLKLLVWPLIAALLFGLVNFGEIVEDGLRIARNKLHLQPASGDIVIVEIDEQSLRKVGHWPWPRSKQAEIYLELARLNAGHIVADINYTGATRPAEDRALAEALDQAGNVTLAAMTRTGDGSGKEDDAAILPAFAKRSAIASSSLSYNWQLAVWSLPRGHTVDGRLVPSLASVIAGADRASQTEFPVDYSFDPDTIPRVNVADLMAGKVERGRIAGKTAVVGTNSFIIGDQYRVPGWGKRGGVFVHVLGAETLKRGTPRDASWPPALLIALIAAAYAVTRGRLRYLGLATGAMLLLPIPLEHWLVFVDVTPALFLIGVVAARMLWRRSRQREMVNALTGLPNLAALNACRAGRDQPLVAVRVHNYAAIASTLDQAGERQFVEQVVQRLSLGNRERIIYQGDEGIFAWFADKDTPFAAHLDALHSMFRLPVKVGRTTFDVALSFGVELGGGRSISSRLGSALVAADEAEAEALRWKYHDPERMQDVPWRLSLLSQLDEAIDRGEVWLAFQPKLDLARQRTVGAEALARWTHPEKGPISPTEFVSAAEQSDRIAHLTDYVLEQAIAAGARINRSGHEFEIAANLSGRMLGDRDFPHRVAGMLRRHGLKPDRLILELTETAAVSGSGSGIEMLLLLRQLGVRIAIDDYGTGLSTLDYLKKVPASELKIDQSFVKSMRENRSDLIMVQSTITLAHSLGRTVVAEGVEDPHSLEQLKAMGCDQAQGFVVGRPMSLDELVRRLEAERRRTKAA